MSCKGLSGRKYRHCMKDYVSQSTKQFPTFNQVQDTVSTTIESNSINGIRHWKKNSKNPTIKSEDRAISGRVFLRFSMIAMASPPS